MASTGVNVLRWSALATGVFYGAWHASTIRSADRIAAAKHEYERKEKLITQAKAEFARKTAPTTAGGGLISDPEDPKFDLEAFLKAKAAES
ncbi:ATP synthase E chain-domain-containing protein [Elsinoe ampelina]|uniref:ATP synthase F(0) complex subunit e, mitochondrial n=1 Tax=Elsinoe ampelina TaxID=302913 RepID=A0A6A6GIS3_9PEZI|nr:ATP synthase E chain-domain-containing protein [Elsinoe ampelina]